MEVNSGGYLLSHHQFKFFKPDRNFQTSLFFFGHLSIKKGKYLFAFLYPILSYSRWVPLDLCYPPATLPLPPNLHYAWILIISRFHFFLFISYSPGFEPPTCGSAYHCHYHLAMKAVQSNANTYFNYQYFTPSPSHIDFNLFINTYKF